MHSDLTEVGWGEEQWNRICSTVAEEAQRSRVAAQFLPLSGPEPKTTVAVPNYTLSSDVYDPPLPDRRLRVNSEPNLPLTRISVNVYLRSHEVADLDLKAALVMFRRAANYIARIEDALIFNGRVPPFPPPTGIKIPAVFKVSGDGPVAGIFIPRPGEDGRSYEKVAAPSPGSSRGQPLVSTVVSIINQLEEKGQLGPYACVLGHDLFEAVNDPTGNLVLPSDRILPFLQGPLLRSSAILPRYGTVIALSGTPVELVVATDIHVRYLQTTLEPRFVFRVSERVALRIIEDSAIGIIEQS